MTEQEQVEWVEGYKRVGKVGEEGDVDLERQGLESKSEDCRSSSGSGQLEQTETLVTSSKKNDRSDDGDDDDYYEEFQKAYDDDDQVEDEEVLLDCKGLGGKECFDGVGSGASLQKAHVLTG